MAGQTAIYRFGPFELRARTRELYKFGIKVKLRSQAFQVLMVLVERSGDAVRREELRQLLWPHETFGNFEHGLNATISELRSVLSDTATDPKFIETLPRLGYRMIARVAEVEAIQGVKEGVEQGAQAGTGTEHGFENGLAAAEPRPGSSRLQWLAIAVAVCTLGIATAQWLRSRDLLRAAKETERSRQNLRIMLAVLPFENLTGDPRQEYLSDGLTEEMIAQMGKLDPTHFGVIARTSVMHYKNNKEPMNQIGQELGVQYVLEGSVRRDANRLRVTAQLIKTNDQTQLWTREYDREPSNMLVLQDEIAQEAANEIRQTIGEKQTALSSGGAPRKPGNQEAYDLYLKGMYFWNKRTINGFQQAINYFQTAVTKDPTYAPAYAGLANSYSLLTGYSGVRPLPYMEKAKEAALRAVALDDSLPEAHTALALVMQNHDWDWQRAEREFKRAIELNPNYATAHHWYSEHLGFRGRFEEALEESERARQLDPLSLIIAADQGVLFYYSRQYDRAIEKLRAVLEMDPDFSRAKMILYAYLERGQFKEATEIAEAMARVPDHTTASLGVLAYVYGRAGKPKQGRHALEELLKADRETQAADPSAIAWANLGIGRRDEALKWLEKSYSLHSQAMTMLKAEPGYDPLRKDARFQDLLHRVGLGD
jgi:TolB-like protein/DNA-binding winged helix-turn-helix (wHTH) protein/Tfp pilus assembly protein PilF